MEPMKIIVAKLKADDMTAIAAYVASEFPPDPTEATEAKASASAQ